MNGLPRRYHITTFGCQMNKADSERMAGILEDMGFEWSENPQNANLIVYNTCTIRDNAEQKVYSYLGRQAKRKHQEPDLTLVVAGCVAQQEGQALLRRVPELDLVMGPQYANRLKDLLDSVFAGNQVVATEEVHILEDITQPRRDSRVTAWVNVIYGCNERCTYCVVPNVRGVEQSRTPEAIRGEMEILGQQGYREITLWVKILMLMAEIYPVQPLKVAICTPLPIYSIMSTMCRVLKELDLLLVILATLQKG